jgi:hypothetical protein
LRLFLRELSKQHTLKAADASFIDGAGMMGHDAHKPLVSALLAEKASAVNRMKPVSVRLGA